jgi:hypothetical protein
MTATKTERLLERLARHSGDAETAARAKYGRLIDRLSRDRPAPGDTPAAVSELLRDLGRDELQLARDVDRARAFAALAERALEAPAAEQLRDVAAAHCRGIETRLREHERLLRKELAKTRADLSGADAAFVQAAAAMRKVVAHADPALVGAYEAASRAANELRSELGRLEAARTGRANPITGRAVVSEAEAAAMDLSDEAVAALEGGLRAADEQAAEALRAAVATARIPLFGEE